MNLIGLVLVSAALVACSAPAATSVPRVTIVNGTAYDLEVEVSGRDGLLWLPLGMVEAGATEVVREVVDQGEVWMFRFRHWGDPVGELSLTRDELERSGWRVEIPDGVAEPVEP